jgi:hypothetical protein
VPTDDARARAGVDADARAGARADTDRPRAGVDANARTGARADADRTRAGADIDARNRARVDTGDRDGRAGARADARADARTSSRLTANWADRSRTQLRQDVREVRSNLSSAMQRDLARSGDRNVRDWDNWRDRDPARFRNWNRWGSNVRSSFRWGGGSPYYTSRWWNGRNLIGLGLGNFAIGSGGGGWWGYQPWLSSYGYDYWWSRPRWSSFYSWFPNYGWSSPFYYDYGPYGNVVYRGDQVLVGGQYVGTPAEYAVSAADLAYIDPNEIEPTPADGWKPLGTFSVAVSEDEQNPPRVIQLAVNKDGILSGTIFNRNSDKLYTVQGRVDPETQRVAFTIGDDPNVVLETGIYNLTLDETPVLVHFGENKTATYLFVRLEEPAALQAASPGEEALR